MLQNISNMQNSLLTLKESFEYSVLNPEKRIFACQNAAICCSVSAKRGARGAEGGDIIF